MTAAEGIALETTSEERTHWHFGAVAGGWIGLHHTYRDRKPTHWQPLPAPPQSPDDYEVSRG